MPNYPFSVDGDLLVPADTIPGPFLFGPLPLAYGQTVVLSALQEGAWFANEYIGPNYTSDSRSSVDSFFPRGCGFFRVPFNGTLSSFKWSNATPPGSPIPVDLYIAPLGNVAALSYSGISLTMAAGAYLADNSIDILTVFADDIIVFYNPGPIGYTPNGMNITAQYVRT
jgi:hypothetical protein